MKLIKHSMDTRRVVARFESERQALALMNHPHIAAVFDAGTSADGRPYFVMEYVDGVPITAALAAISTSSRRGPGSNCSRTSARACSTRTRRA